MLTSKPLAATFCVLVCLLSGMTFASQGRNRYDDIIQDCTDYGHGGVTPERLRLCKAVARDEVLADYDVSQRFLDCIDYGHSPVSALREEECLREASAF